MIGDVVVVGEERTDSGFRADLLCLRAARPPALSTVWEILRIRRNRGLVHSCLAGKGT